jgi:hypothetical protein
MTHLKVLHSLIYTYNKYGDRGIGFRFLAAEIFLLTVFMPILRPTHPPIQWVPEALSLVVRQARREADHSVQSSIEVNNAFIHHA